MGRVAHVASSGAPAGAGPATVATIAAVAIAEGGGLQPAGIRFYAAGYSCVGNRVRPSWRLRQPAASGYLERGPEKFR